MSTVRRVCFPFVGNSVGGAHLSTLLLIEGLDRSRFEPLIVLHTEGPLAEHLRLRNLNFSMLPLETFAGATPRLMDIVRAAIQAVPKLSAFIRRNAIDIVHANDLRMNLTWPLAAKVSGAKMIWHQRTTPASNSALWRTIPYLANETIAISTPVAAALGRTGREGSFFGRGTFDKARERADLLRSIGVSDPCVVFGSVAKLVRDKRPDVCVDLVSALRARLDVPVHCVFLGADPDGLTASLADQAQKLGVADHVHFLGFRFPVERYVSGLDFLVAPGEIEDSGRTLVEAMLVETPVVAARVGRHAEIVSHEETGMLVPAGDVAAFAAAAVAIIRNDSLREEMTRRALVDARRIASTAVSGSA